jgi:hypothetical protein
MDKLEQYLDQVCRGIGGPRSLRQHIRQELREHLLDAAADHRAAGMSEEQAIGRALEDFGGSEQVRSELEATHGHRLMAVVIDKAMQWKEITMKAKWFWTSWAHMALALVVAAEVTFVSMAMIFVVPKFRQMVRDGMLIADSRDTSGVTLWALNVLHGIEFVSDNGLWLVIAVAAMWALFEWRVRGENKSLIRLSIMGTAALGLMVVVALTAAALVLPFMVQVPAMNAQAPKPIVGERLAQIDKSIDALSKAMTNKDWQAIEEQTSSAYKAADALTRTGGAAAAIVSAGQQPKVDELRVQIKSANDCLRQARDAARQRDATRLETAMQGFRVAYVQVQAATTRPLK